MRTDMSEILKLGETQTVEFKESLSLQRQALEALCGMLNSDSATGKVLFGVSRDGSVGGVEEGNLDSAQRKLVQKVRDRFDPRLICSIEVLESNNKTLVCLKADRAPEIPYYEYRGRAYIREGSTTRQLSYDEKRQLGKKRDRNRHGGPWKCDLCGTVVGILVSMLITDQGVKKSYACKCGGDFWPIT